MVFFVIESPVLDITTQGRNLVQARKRFVELVHIFFEEITEMETADEVLTSFGWTKVKNKWQPPVVVESGLQEITIPASARFLEYRDAELYFRGWEYDLGGND